MTYMLCIKKNRIILIRDDAVKSIHFSWFFIVALRLLQNRFDPEKMPLPALLSAPAALRRSARVEL